MEVDADKTVLMKNVFEMLVGRIRADQLVQESGHKIVEQLEDIIMHHPEFRTVSLDKMIVFAAQQLNVNNNELLSFDVLAQLSKIAQNTLIEETIKVSSVFCCPFLSKK